MTRCETDVLAEYSELIETIRKIKRDRHSKRVELELILVKYEDRETVRVFIERLVKVGVLILEMDNKERKLISTTDVDVHTVLERLMISENNEENDCGERRGCSLLLLT